MIRLQFRPFGSPENLEATKQAILSDPEAKKSYQSMCESGLGSKFGVELFLELVSTVATLSTEPKGKPVWFVNEVRRLKPAQFPRRLRNMADEIQRIQESALFRPDKKFAGLAGELTAYAEDFEREWTGRRANRKTTYGHMLDSLTRNVSKETGPELHADLARILTAVASQITPDPNTIPNFEDALKMRRYRARRA